MFVDTIDVISTPSSEWYDDINFYLTHGYDPPILEFKQCRILSLKETPYHFIDNVIFRRNYDGVFLRCLEKLEADNLLFEMQVGLAEGHFSGETTAHKVLRDGYYWMTLFKNAHTFVRKCDAFQRCVGKLKKPAFPLHLVSVQFPFQQWVLDFVGPITPPSTL